MICGNGSEGGAQHRRRDRNPLIHSRCETSGGGGAAEQRIRVRTQTYDTRVDDALARYANVERKVDELEAYAETIRGVEPTLEQEFAALERNDAIEEELNALKKKRAKSTPKAAKPAEKKEA